MEKISKDEFIKRLQLITSAKSVTGVKYDNIRIVGNICTGIRTSTQKPFEIYIDRLYEAYLKCSVFTTTSIKPYVNRVQSPSLAILKEMGLA